MSKTRYTLAETEERTLALSLAEKKTLTFSLSGPAGPSGPEGPIGLTGGQGIQGIQGSDANVTNANVNAAIETAPADTRTSLELGTAATADTGTAEGQVPLIGFDGKISTNGNNATIFTTGSDAYIFTSGEGASISTSGTNAFILTRDTFKLFNGANTTTLDHSATAEQTITFPDATGTIALTSDLTDFATAAQGATADAALPRAGGAMTGEISFTAGSTAYFDSSSVALFDGGTASFGNGMLNLRANGVSGKNITLNAIEPTDDQTITFPDATGTVALTSDLTDYATAVHTHVSDDVTDATSNGDANKGKILKTDGSGYLTLTRLVTSALKAIGLAGIDVQNSAGRVVLRIGTGTSNTGIEQRNGTASGVYSHAEGGSTRQRRLYPCRGARHIRQRRLFPCRGARHNRQRNRIPRRGRIHHRWRIRIPRRG
jgi:hypothetical protein